MTTNSTQKEPIATYNTEVFEKLAAAAFSVD